MTKPGYVDEQGWAKILATAWSEPEFLAAFEEDPVAAVGNRFGNNPVYKDKILFQLPGKPADLTDEDLKKIQNGNSVAVPYTCAC